MQRSIVLDTAIFEAQKEASSGLQNIYFIDLTDALCQAEICWAVQGNEIMYRDNNHLTATFADHLAPLIENRLFAILGQANSHEEGRDQHRVNGEMNRP